MAASYWSKEAESGKEALLMPCLQDIEQIGNIVDNRPLNKLYSEYKLADSVKWHIKILDKERCSATDSTKWLILIYYYTY